MATSIHVIWVHRSIPVSSWLLSLQGPRCICSRFTFYDHTAARFTSQVERFAVNFGSCFFWSSTIRVNVKIIIPHRFYTALCNVCVARQLLRSVLCSCYVNKSKTFSKISSQPLRLATLSWVHPPSRICSYERRRRSCCHCSGSTQTLLFSSVAPQHGWWLLLQLKDGI